MWLRFVIPLVAVLSLWPHAPPAVAADRITVSSTQPTGFEWDLMVAREQGFFAREDLEVETTYMAPQLVINALIAGQVNIAKSGTHFGLIATARGADIKIVAGGVYGYPYDLISRPEFRSLADLKGQKIAGATLASITTAVFKDLMSRNGIPPSDYTLLFIGGSPERFQALRSGQVAASLAEAPPFNFRAIDSGDRVLLRYSDVVKDMQYVSYFVTPKFAAANRPLIIRFLRAVAQSQRWLGDPANERRAVQILTQHLKTDEQTASRSYRYLIVEAKAFRGDGKIDGPGLSEMIRLLAEYQLIPKKEPWESFADPSFVSEVRATGEK